MAKKCLYCSTELADSCVIDFCDRCGVGVFGQKMLSAIKSNMTNAHENGDLDFGTCKAV